MMRWSWGNKRLLVLAGAFALLLLAPLLNYYYDINFIQGWYQSIGIGDFWIVSPLEGLESLLVTREPFGPLLAALFFPVLLALLLGRVFCSWICPITFLTEVSERLKKLLSKKTATPERWTLFRQMLWFALGLELFLTLVLGAPIFVFMSPPGLIGRELMMLIFFRTLPLEGLIIILVLILNLTSKRFYCRYLCPLGAFLALLGMKRRVRIENILQNCKGCRTCDRACPMGLSPSVGEGTTVYCWNCGTCIDNCPYGQLVFKVKKEESRPPIPMQKRS